MCVSADILLLSIKLSWFFYAKEKIHCLRLTYQHEGTDTSIVVQTSLELHLRAGT